MLNSLLSNQISLCTSELSVTKFTLPVGALVGKGLDFDCLAITQGLGFIIGQYVTFINNLESSFPVDLA